MGKFKDLRVWNDSMDLATQVYEVTQDISFAKDFAFINQIRRAAVSIASNIAEGDERGTNREAVHFFNIAKGSSAEVITQLNIAFRVGYIDEARLLKLENLAEKVRASLKNLIQSRGGSNPFTLIIWLLISLIRPI
jgi:four helix bundle protein